VLPALARCSLGASSHELPTVPATPAGAAGVAAAASSSSRGASSSSSNAAGTAAARHKEAGNTAFKRRDYGQAVRSYTDGVAALAGAERSATARQLLLDLTTNLALTLIRQAEAQPAGGA
jgi:hypothetical protein